MKWETYNPEWLVELAIEQIPEETELIKSIRNCTKALQESRAYIYFVNPTSPNKPVSKWIFKRNFMLKHKTDGQIVLDILSNDKIGGIEFLKYL